MEGFFVPSIIVAIAELFWCATEKWVLVTKNHHFGFQFTIELLK